MVQEIMDYLKGQKEQDLKTKIKAKMEEGEKSALLEKIEKKFEISSFLGNVSKKVSNLKFHTHVYKISDPSIKGGVYFEGKKDTDGFVRTGNAVTDIDISVTAASLPIAKFLKHTLSDGKTVFEHIEGRSTFLNKLFKGNGFEEFRDNVIALKNPQEVESTENKLKQVFYPVDLESFHLLSVVTPSGLMFEIKERINDIRYFRKSKEAKKLKNKKEYSEVGFNEIYGITEIGFGGSKPQNISFLNSKNKGIACLLSSIPPTLRKRKIYPPRRDFFKDTLKIYKFKGLLTLIHKILINDRNNFKIRNKRDSILESIVDLIIESVWALRGMDSGWSQHKEYTRLPEYQKIWLDSVYKDQREEDDEWADTMIKDVSLWILSSYAEIFKEKAVVLEEGEQMYIESFIRSNKEILR